MTKKDVDDLIEIMKEESDEKLIEFSKRNGINSSEDIGEYLESLSEKIKKDKNLYIYFQLKIQFLTNEKIIGIAKETNLNKILENARKYGLDESDILNIVMNLDNVKLLKKITSIEKDGLDKKALINIVKSMNDNKFRDKIIDNADRYGLDRKDVLSIIRYYADDEELIKKIAENLENYKLNETNLIELIIYSNNRELTEDVVSNPQKYKLNRKDIVEIIVKMVDRSLREKIIDNAEKYGLDKKDIICITVEKNSSSIAEKVIEKADKYNLDQWDIYNIVTNINDKKLIEKVINNAEKYKLGTQCIFRIACDANDEKLIKTILYNINPSEYKFIRNEIDDYSMLYADLDFIKDNLSIFLKIYDIENKDEIIKRMYEKNNEILRANLYLFTDRILENLSEDTLNQMCCYYESQDCIRSLDDSQLKILGKSITFFKNKTQSEDWTYLASRIIRNIASYQQLIDSIKDKDDVDIEKLISIIIHPNKFDIRTTDDISNYDTIKKEKCKELMNSDNIENKIEGVLQKIFNISTSEAEEQVSKFVEDIDCIKNEELKRYIKSIKKIINLTDPKLLDELFNNVAEIENNNIIINERMLKNEYGILYNRGLFRVENAQKIDDQFNMYDAGTNFKMIITSVAPYIKNQPENYYKDWNRPAIESQHFCTSYIRNDMMGHADIPHICYGFEKMAENSLVLSGNSDIYSSERDFVSEAYRTERYLSPDSQINETEGYNEIDFKRIQDGKKKQPDYIVVFKRNEKIDNIEKAQKASKEFGGLPIVVIDVDECLKIEKQKVEELHAEYQETNNISKAQELYQKIRNNRVTDGNFCEEIDLEELKQEILKKEKVQDQDLEEIYLEIDAEERKEEMNKLHNMYKSIINIFRKNEKHER